MQFIQNPLSLEFCKNIRNGWRVGHSVKLGRLGTRAKMGATLEKRRESHRFFKMVESQTRRCNIK